MDKKQDSSRLIMERRTMLLYLMFFEWLQKILQ